MNEFLEMFLKNTKPTDDNTKWLFKGFYFDDNLNKEIQFTVNHMKYSEFLKTTYWKTIASIVKEDRGDKCEKCGCKKHLEVHHKTYEHHGFEHLKNIKIVI